MRLPAPEFAAQRRRPAMTSGADDPERSETLEPGMGYPGTDLAHDHPADARPLGSGYFLVRPIGRGTSGRVWHGQRRSDGAWVAVKILREDFLADPKVITRFLRERQTLRALHHPHLVSVLDLVVEGDTLAVVMELVDGHDARRLLRSGPVDPYLAATIVAQIADALSHVHAARVLHRDVKPENLLVATRDGQPWAYLTDFGLAWTPETAALTNHAQLLGTPAYLAPEILTDRPYGAAVDVYALGVTAYELFAGVRPFTARHPLALMRAHLEDEPARPDTMADDVWQIVRACLAKQAEDRPTAREVSEAFDAILNAPDPPAEPEPEPEPVPAVPEPPPEQQEQPTGPRSHGSPDRLRPGPPRRLRGLRWGLLPLAALIVAALIVAALIVAGVGQ